MSSDNKFESISFNEFINLELFIKKFGKKNSFVEAILNNNNKFGSKNHSQRLDDLEYTIIINEKTINRAKNRLINEFKEITNFNFSYSKYIVFYQILRENFPIKTKKIRFLIVKNFMEIELNLNSLNIGEIEFESLFVYFNNELVKKKIKNLIKVPKTIKNDEKLILSDKIFEFLDLFDFSSRYASFGDLYNHTLALQKCYSILYEFNYFLSRGISLHNHFNNDNWLTHLNKYKSFFMNNFPKNTLKNLSTVKIRYSETFLDIINEINTKFSMNFDLKFPSQLLNIIIKRDHFWNLRDISDISPDIKSKSLFRSSALARYLEDPFLSDLLEDTKIKSIIDLRMESEIKKYPYFDYLKHKGIQIHSIPIGPKQNFSKMDLKYVSLNDYNAFYEIFPRYYQKEILEILTKFLDSTIFPALIHCYAGRDRTGLIIFLLQKMIGIDNENIILEYLHSGSYASKENIDIFMKVLEEYGGVNSYLATIGFEEKNFDKMKKIILKNF